MIHVGREIYGYDFQYFVTIDVQSYYPNTWTEKDFKNHEVRVARVAKYPIAYAAFQTEGNYMRLKRFAVFPPHRRTGIGTRLMAYVIDEAEDTAIRKITIVLRETNIEGCLFLRSMGFEAKHSMKDHFGEEDGIFFKRNIA